MRKIIADTSGILVLLDAGAAEHAPALAVTENAELILSPLVLADIDYKVATKGGGEVALEFARQVREGTYTLAPWNVEDHSVAVEVASQYSGYIGLADASNVVLANRYKTTELLTLDERHFRHVTPLDGGHFTLVPADS